MQYVIDRVEGEFAVAELESGAHADLPLAALPAGCREGSVVRTGPAPAGASRRVLKVVRVGALFSAVETAGAADLSFPSRALPGGCRAGDSLTLWLDSAAEQERRRAVRELENDVWAD